MTSTLVQPPLDSAIDLGARPNLHASPPFTRIETVTDVLHGVSIADPYRWLEDSTSPETRQWTEEQTHYARAYLDGIPGRENIREQVRSFLAVQTYDSLRKVGNRYFFRKRLPNQEQPGIYMRDGADGEDECLVDPGLRGTGDYTAVKPLVVSPNGRVLLYEVKEGGERTGRFELLDVESRERLPDSLPRGYLRGFAFAPDGKSFYYVHETLDAAESFRRVAYRHFLGTAFEEDREVFSVAGSKDTYLTLISADDTLVLLTCHYSEPSRTDVRFAPLDGTDTPKLILEGVEKLLQLRLIDRRILALTDHDAPNRRIVELVPQPDGTAQYIDVVPQSDASIRGWLIVGDRIVVQYAENNGQQFVFYDLSGQRQGEIPVRSDHTLHLLVDIPGSDELFLAEESFTEPLRIFRYSRKAGKHIPWSRITAPIDPKDYEHTQVWIQSRDGTKVPMYLVGHRDVLAAGDAPTVMTAYGGYGISVSPQFSTFVACLMERGCLFALPGIRGGSEFGAHWHEMARRRNRQTAFDDFLSAAEWLVESGRTDRNRLAIFGGSNSGLLVGVALTQRPDLFSAVLCMVPLLDMLRYHLFDQARGGKDEFGTVEDAADFSALSAYSPYHNVRDGVSYPAIMMVSGDADQNCNPLHARKMTARLQAGNASGQPIVLDYSRQRGHSPVLPLSTRVEALTDRLAFLCDRLQLVTT